MLGLLKLKLMIHVCLLSHLDVVNVRGGGRVVSDNGPPGVNQMTPIWMSGLNNCYMGKTCFSDLS